MKKLYAIIYLLMLTIVGETAVFLILAPEQIPAHYNFAGQVDRFGSKYEMLLFPAIALFAAGCFLAAGRQQRKKRQATGERQLAYVSIYTLLFFTVLGFYFMRKALMYDKTAPVSFQTVSRMITVAGGLLLIVIGNFLPKLRRNRFAGLRTRWALTDDVVWQKSQRISGISAVIGGICMIICALLFSGPALLICSSGITLGWIIGSAVYSYHCYRTKQSRSDRPA
ncbi:MAG: SdpI family protein [Lachnospiraceae bacterium]|nr:SdpI family protein [Lachnospiraceae bacterium]MDY5741443.1 SdpI family protein [Lachnospiraceae bacterium]